LLLHKDNIGAARIGMTMADDAAAAAEDKTEQARRDRLRDVGKVHMFICT
jgi:hypothetical protein